MSRCVAGEKTYVQCFSRGYPGVFSGADFDPDADFVRDDTQILQGSRQPRPKDHGTSVQILFDAEVAPDSVIDIGRSAAACARIGADVPGRSAPG